MLPREHYVCSFSQARKLLSLGLNLETYWFYRKNGTLMNVDSFHWASESYLPAYTTTELGVLLGKYQVTKIVMGSDNQLFNISNDSNTFSLWLSGEFNNKPEAQVRAEVLICLINSKDISVDDLKLQFLS